MTQAMPQQQTRSSQPRGTAVTHYAWLSLLRAYGVVLVLGYHFFPWLLPGGFIGVDVFFVFSGYLITSLLINEFRTQGKVRLLGFYARRFRRLLPALVALIVVVVPLALTIPADFRADLARQVAAALSWTTNFYEIAGGQSYGDALLPHLFVHTWTLSIEMQYYVLWGLLLTVLLPLFLTTSQGGNKSITRSRKIIAALAAVLAVVSFIAMQVMLIGAEDPSAAYYSTLSHSFPILIGSALGALAGFGRTRLIDFFARLRAPLAIAVTALCLVAITAMALLIPFDNYFVYHAGLLITSLLIGLIILVGRGAQQHLQKIPEPKVLKYIADRTYSLYLFHWPIMIIVLEWARALFGTVQLGPDPLYIAVALVALALTFVVAHLSYQFIERPFASKRAAARDESRDRKHDTRSDESRDGSRDESRNRRNQRHTATRNESHGVAPDEAHHNKQNSTRDTSYDDIQHETRVEAPRKTLTPKVLKSRLILAALAVVLVGASVFSLASAPLKTSIESDYQAGLLEIDMRQIESSHRALVHTGQGGSRGGEPGLLVRPGSITVIGDSVTILPAESISSATGAFVDAEVNRAMVNGIAIVESMQNNKTLGEYVVIALATNAHGNSYESALALCDLLAPGHRLIFVTAYGTPAMAALNDDLRTLPAQYPFVTIASWDYAISGRSDLLAADGFHLNGQEAIDIYTNTVVQALEEASHKPTS